MTRAQGSGSRIDIRSFGVAGAPRTVLVLGTGPAALLDQGPAATVAHDVRIVAIELGADELVDPPTFGGETAAESAVNSLALIARREGEGSPVALVAEQSVAPLALALAAQAPDVIDRLVLVGATEPDSALAADLLAETMSSIAVDALLIHAPGTGGSQWYVDHLPLCRVTSETAPAEAGGRLALTAVWERVLTHVAPRVAPTETASEETA